jgi:hypothetical protein
MGGKLFPPSPLFLSFSFLFPSLFPPFPSATASHEAPIPLGFSLALSASSEVSYLLSCTSTKKSSAISFTICGFCENWQGFGIENFQSRSTHLRQFSHATHLSTMNIVVPRFQRHQPPFIPLPTALSVVCMRQQVDLFHRPVQAYLSSPLSTTSAAVGFWLCAALMGDERSPKAGAWFTRVGHGEFHPPTPIIFVALNFLLFLGISAFLVFIVVYHLCILCFGYHGVWVLWIPYQPFTTFIGDPSSCDPYQEQIGPHLRKHCFRVLLFLGFTFCYFGLPSPSSM